MCGDFYATILFLALVCCANGQEGAPCEAPPDVRGSCVPVTSCKEISSLLRGSLTNEIRSYVKGLLCGYDSSRSPLICCPNASTRTVITGNNGDDIPSEETSNDIGPFLSWPECGKSNGSIPKVVGGIDATLGQFPWMAELGYFNQKNPEVPRWLCGGSLVTYKHVLTAAHCVKGFSDLYVVRVGELDLYSDDDGAQPVNVPIASRVFHEQYSDSAHTNDIAVLTLERSTRGFPGVMPICLPWKPEQRKSLVGYSLFVAGWGSIYFGGPRSSRLQVASVKAIDNSKCKAKFQTASIIDDRILCAENPTMDSCKGDSGGPLMHGQTVPGKQGIHFELSGIVSYGFRCAEPGWPGVYTKVTQFLNWISKNIDNKLA